MSDTSAKSGASRPRKRDLPAPIAPIVPVQISSDVETQIISEFELRALPPRLIARGPAADRLVPAVSVLLIMAGVASLIISLGSLRNPFEKAHNYLHDQACTSLTHSDKKAEP
jgi:hypothetical protein